MEVLVLQEDVIYTPIPCVAVSVRSSGVSSCTDTATCHSCQEQQHEAKTTMNSSSSDIGLQLQFILYQPLGLKPPSKRLNVRRLSSICSHHQTVSNRSPSLLLPSIPVFQRRLNGPVKPNGMVLPSTEVICQYLAEYQFSKSTGNVIQIAGPGMGSPVSIDLDSVVDFRELTNTDYISRIYLHAPLKNSKDHLYDSEELLREVCNATGVQPAVMDYQPYFSQAVVIPTVWETADPEAKKPAFSNPCLHMTARIVFSHRLAPLKSCHISYHFVDLQALIIDVQDGNEGE